MNHCIAGVMLPPVLGADSRRHSFLQRRTARLARECQPGVVTIHGFTDDDLNDMNMYLLNKSPSNSECQPGVVTIHGFIDDDLNDMNMYLLNKSPSNSECQPGVVTIHGFIDDDLNDMNMYLLNKSPRVIYLFFLEAINAPLHARLLSG